MIVMHPCRFIAIAGLVVGLVVAKVCMTVVILSGHPLPLEMVGLSVTTLGALVWVVKSVPDGRP